jgi:hypothetical protein
MHAGPDPMNGYVIARKCIFKGFPIPSVFRGMPIPIKSPYPAIFKRMYKSSKVIAVAVSQEHGVNAGWSAPGKDGSDHGLSHVEISIPGTSPVNQHTLVSWKFQIHRLTHAGIHDQNSA